MEKLSTLTSCLLLVVGTVTAQTAPAQSSERPLPQWLTGIIAVCAFLFLAFITILVKKAWCEKPSRRRNSVESVRENIFMTGDTYDTSLDGIRRKDDTNTSQNLGMDVTVEKVTAM